MEMPAFDFLESSAMRDKYFARTCSWRVDNGKTISVYDKYQPRVVTLDPWPQIVFLEATGDRTVRDFVRFMASSYTGPIPPELDEVILKQIERLLDERLLELSDAPIAISPDILEPMH